MIKLGQIVRMSGDGTRTELCVVRQRHAGHESVFFVTRFGEEGREPEMVNAARLKPLTTGELAVLLHTLSYGLEALSGD